MAEFVGSSGLLVNALDADALASALQDAIGPRHDELAKAALEQAEQYTWAKAAQLTVDAYRSVAS